MVCCRAATGAAPEAKDLLDVYLEAEEAEGEGSISNEQMLKNIFDVFLGGACDLESILWLGRALWWWWWGVVQPTD